MIKISIVVPVYNVESYILKCIDSILMQTLQEIEVIFVDDHGNDRTIDIAKAYLLQENPSFPFQFIETPKNLGPGSARNLGIECARGEYLSFIDADDWIEPDYCEKLYTTAKKYDCDLCVCQAWMDFKNNRKSKLLRFPSFNNGTMVDSEKKRFITEFVPYHCNYLFKREFILQYKIRYPSFKSSEDSYFVIMAALFAKRMAKISAPFYHYIIRETSISHRQNASRHKVKFKVFAKLINDSKINSLYSLYHEEIDFLFIKKGLLMSVFEYIRNAKHISYHKIKNFYDDTEKLLPCIVSNKYLKVKFSYKLLMFLLKYMPFLIVWCVKSVTPEIWSKFKK